jgi:Putative zinc-finger
MVGMDCQQCREAISARLDGEATEAESVAVDVHLGWCADCRAALDRAEWVTRMARECAVEPGPDPATVLLAAWDAAMAPAGRGADLDVVPVGNTGRSSGCASDVRQLHTVGASECACAAGCACGCQSGRPCRCGQHAA